MSKVAQCHFGIGMCYRLVGIFGLWFSLLIWTKWQRLRLVLYFARWDTNLNEGLDMVTVVLGYSGLWHSYLDSHCFWFLYGRKDAPLESLTTFIDWYFFAVRVRGPVLLRLVPKHDRLLLLHLCNNSWISWSQYVALTESCL